MSILKYITSSQKVHFDLEIDEIIEILTVYDEVSALNFLYVCMYD